MRIAVPEANPGLSIGAALGVTFPFNLFVGIPVYYWMALTIHQLGGRSEYSHPSLAHHRL